MKFILGVISELFLELFAIYSRAVKHPCVVFDHSVWPPRVGKHKIQSSPLYVYIYTYIYYVNINMFVWWLTLYLMFDHYIYMYCSHATDIASWVNTVWWYDTQIAGWEWALGSGHAHYYAHYSNTVRWYVTNKLIDHNKKLVWNKKIQKKNSLRVRVTETFGAKSVDLSRKIEKID